MLSHNRNFGELYYYTGCFLPNLHTQEVTVKKEKRFLRWNLCFPYIIIRQLVRTVEVHFISFALTLRLLRYTQ